MHRITESGVIVAGKNCLSFPSVNVEKNASNDRSRPTCCYTIKTKSNGPWNFRVKSVPEPKKRDKSASWRFKTVRWLPWIDIHFSLCWGQNLQTMVSPWKVNVIWIRVVREHPFGHFEKFPILNWSLIPHLAQWLKIDIRFWFLKFRPPVLVSGPNRNVIRPANEMQTTK